MMVYYILEYVKKIVGLMNLNFLNTIVSKQRYYRIFN